MKRLTVPLSELPRLSRLTMSGLLLCGVLAGVVASELLTEVQDSDAPQARGVQARVATPETGAVKQSGGKAAVSIIQARPVFSPNRSPVAKSQPALFVNMAVKPFNRRLSGVVIEPSMRAAMFAGEGKSRGVIVKEGELIEGWFLERVTPVNVTLRAAGASQVIELIKTKHGKDSQSSKTAQTTIDSQMPSFISPLLSQDR